MRIPRSNRFFLNPGEKETLARMARNCAGVIDVEKSEISDGDSSESLEEISADDFRQDCRCRRSRSRVWNDDMINYSVANGFGPNLYSFAWAQAVQNKPLGLEMKPVKGADLETGKDGSGDVVNEDNREDSAHPMEKEGELEEGEIDLESEFVADELIILPSHKVEDESKAKEPETKETEDKEESDMEDFDRRVGEILEELDTITSEEAEASFEGVCSRLLKSFAGLKSMFAESHVPVVDALVQQAFMGIQTLHSVFCSGFLKKTNQNMDLLLRLLIHIKNQYSILLTQEQVIEIDSMAQLLVSNDVSKEETTQKGCSGISSDSAYLAARSASPCSASPENLHFDRKETDLSGIHRGGIDLPKLDPPFNGSRVEFSPLLDLHADYDEGSLPSPTRESAPPFPILKPIGFGAPAISHPTVLKKAEDEDAALHSYVNDALKAVSSYQQKYGNNSILPSNQLPSPTPSEECLYEDDKNDEISSLLVVGNAKTAKNASSLKPVGSGSSCAPADLLSGPHSAPGMLEQLNSLQSHALNAKSRDPRLRFINRNMGVSSVQNVSGSGHVQGQTSYKKHKAAADSLREDNLLKRQRHSTTIPKDAPMNMTCVIPEMNGKSHLNNSMEVGMRTSGNVVTNSDTSADDNGMSFSASGGNEQNPTVSSAPPISLPSLLKDIAVNPKMLMELVKIEQQRLTAESKQKSGTLTGVTVQKTIDSGLSGGVSINGFTLKPPVIEQNSSTKPQIFAQIASSKPPNDGGRLRMKPRDPRRILHNNTVQKIGTSGSENKMESSHDSQNNKDRLKDRDSGQQTQALGVPTQPTPVPNISWQVTKNHKNVADTMSSSKLMISPISGPPIISQPIPGMTSKQDGKLIMMDSNDTKVASSSSSQTGTKDFTHAKSPWGDMDQLLDGYDDQQKAAIQKERARRIAEQNKMFAAQKLCLVLDLDHTLLNSAKFGEVDQVHEEILRKKEEQDREKPHRHLFRFQHMSMWTKLRPGIWNFLEKASKIFELHLYTMGNKLYATEMAKVLDPMGTLFSGRVISRGDDCDPFDGDERLPKSKDLDGVLGMESAVVIMDDSVRVWPHNKHNLIIVERYTYFPCSRRQFGLLGPSLLEIDHDERPEDGTLASCLSVIERLHQIFFSHRCLNDVDVRHILAAEQRKILAGCRIVFSRVFPVGEANPHLHPLWQTAEQFGSVCTNQIDEQVTHVVANSLGTDKVNWALSTGRFVVHPGWVEASALLYRRANEHDFAVKQ